MKQTAKKVIAQLKSYANPAKSKLLQGFFKTGKGQYGHGDIFLGVMVPTQRIIAKKFKDLPLPEIEKLLHTKIHEQRLTALIILVNQFKRAQEKERTKLYRFYLNNLRWINNWDLVDVTVKDVVGAYLIDKDRRILYKLARSKSIWARRVALVATFYFIGKNDFKDSMSLAKMMLGDKHDLIHKATGWMLREVGKRDINTLLRFLNKYAHRMPRTMLRYSIEKLTPAEKKHYLNM